MQSFNLLAGDIGGTKTHLSVFSCTNGAKIIIAEKVYRSNQFSSLEEIIFDFLMLSKINIQTAAFAVAGPVIKGRVRVTNLPWEIDEKQIQKTFNLISVQIINDLEAIGYYVPFLLSKDLHTLKQGNAILQGTIALLAPGTGLGEAFLCWQKTKYSPCPSEGSHTDFAPRDSLQIKLLIYLQKRFSHVSNETICSGIGIPNIYNFLKEHEGLKEPPWFAQKMESTDDPTQVIIKNALDTVNACDLCKSTLNIFISVLGAEAGNLALKTFATGGVYLSGGIPPRIIPFLEKQLFIDAFINKGKMTELLSNIPIYVILDPKPGLLGAALYGIEQFQNMGSELTRPTLR